MLVFKHVQENQWIFIAKKCQKNKQEKVHCCACLHIIVHKEVHIECAQHKLQYFDGILPPQPFLFVC